MGYSAVIEHGSKPECWAVALKVTLSRAETNELFLAGDAMLSWPTDGLLPSSGSEDVPERSGIFVSEVAAQPAGITIRYSDKAQAEKVAALLRTQLSQAGLEEGA